VRTDTVVVQ